MNLPSRLFATISSQRFSALPPSISYQTRQLKLTKQLQRSMTKTTLSTFAMRCKYFTFCLSAHRHHPAGYSFPVVHSVWDVTSVCGDASELFLPPGRAGFYRLTAMLCNSVYVPFFTEGTRPFAFMNECHSFRLLADRLVSPHSK